MSIIKQALFCSVMLCGAAGASASPQSQAQSHNAPNPARPAPVHGVAHEAKSVAAQTSKAVKPEAVKGVTTSAAAPATVPAVQAATPSPASAPAAAQESKVDPAASAAHAAAVATDAPTLAEYAHLSGPLRITGESSSRTISVPVSAREAVRGAMLHLVASNSVSLLSDRSQLVVRMNDRAIAQFQLSPHQPELTADIRVPADLLRAGYNTLAFSVAQHATENCEEANSPELWTEVDTHASTFLVQTELKPLASNALTLADLGNLIDPRQSTARSLAIVNAAHPETDEQLANGGLLAQGIALRLRYLNADLKVRDAQAGTGGGMLPGLALAPLAGADVLFIGTRDTLKPYLDTNTLAHIDGAFLGVYPKPDDPRHFVLLVSGRNVDEVNLAARVFAHADVPLPRRNEMSAQGFVEPRLGPDTGRNVLSGTAPYRLRQLGFRSATLGMGDTTDLKVMLPPDLYAPENAQVALTLNFVEGAQMRSDSVLNLFLNDQFVKAVALDQQQGGVVDRYRVNLPLRRFKPGENTLSLRPVLVPLVTDRCALKQNANLQLTVFDDSTIELPPASHFTTLPDLRRFAESGFPYALHPDGGDLAVRVTARDNETLAAAWSLVGKLAQKQARPMVAAQITGGVPGVGRNTIVVGAGAEVPQAALAGAPWEPGKSLRLAADGPMAEPVAAAGWWQRISGFVTTPAYAANGAANAPDAVLSGDMPLSRQLLVMQYRGHGDTTTTLLTAASPNELLKGVRRLIEPQNWESLDGDVSVVSFDQSDVWTARVGTRYEVGQIAPAARVAYELSAHPWLGYGALAACLAVLASLTSLLLRRYHRKHHNNA